MAEDGKVGLSQFDLEKRKYQCQDQSSHRNQNNLLWPTYG